MYKQKKCKMSGCGKLFTPTSGNQKYCEDCKEITKRVREKTQWRNQSRKRNNYTEYTKICKFCGITFTTYYKRKINCGSAGCEKQRVILKNRNMHFRRDKKELHLKGKKYYYANREKCLEEKAKYYRKNHPEAREYISGKVHKHSIEFISAYVKERGYTLLSEEYINSKAKIMLRCPHGHKWETTFHSFRECSGNIGARCMTCYLENSYISKFELAVRKVVSETYFGKVQYNNRSTIFNNTTGKFLELDLYFPNEEKAIECDGTYWHNRPSAIIRDKIKDSICSELGINLLRISDEEFNYEESKQNISNFLYEVVDEDISK